MWTDWSAMMSISSRREGSGREWKIVSKGLKVGRRKATSSRHCQYCTELM